MVTFNTSILAPTTFSSYTSSGATSLSREGVYVTERISKLGQKNPGYRALIKAGYDVTSPYSMDCTSLNLGSTSATTQMMTIASNPLQNLYDTHIFNGVPVPIDVIDHEPVNDYGLEAEVLNDVYGRLRSERSAVNGLNFVGELRQTIEMLRRPMSAIRDNVLRVVNTEKQKVSAIRKMRSSVKRRDAFAKMVSGTVLEINFGLAPLVNDVRDIAEALAMQQFAPNPRDRIRASRYAEATRVVDLPSVSLGGMYNYQFRGRIQQRWVTQKSIQYIVGIDTSSTIAQSAVDRLRTNLGFTYENILPTAYELTPWSWLADYFSNLGDIVEASSTDTSNVKWVCRTEKIRTELTRNCVGIAPFVSPSNPVVGSRLLLNFSGPNASSVGVRTTMNRTRSSLSIPSLRWKTPFSNASKISNILSVMEQNRRSVRF